MIKIFNSLLVTMFNLGKIKFIPATFGSFAAAIILFYLFHSLNISTNIILTSFIIIFFYSFYATSYHIKQSKNNDFSKIIIDKALGQSIPIFLYEISHGTTKENYEAIIYYSIFFILFRYFDIMKPFPVSFFHKNFKNCFGVIMDDLCAGVYVVLSMVSFMIIKSYIV